MSNIQFPVLFALLSVSCLGLVACEDPPIPVTPAAGNVSLNLTPADGGGVEVCYEDGSCETMPGGQAWPCPECASIQVDINTADGSTVEQCLDATGSPAGQSCSAGGVECVRVTLPEPDCFLCAWLNGPVVMSTCVPDQPNDCVQYQRSDGVACEICYGADGGEVYDSCGPDCRNVGCPQVLCAAGTEPRPVPGECCEQCVPIDACGDVVCTGEAIMPGCPSGTILVRDPTNCCGYLCEPVECPASTTTSAGGSGQATGTESSCLVDADCLQDSWCNAGLCIPYDPSLCPPGYGWDDTWPNCGRCVPTDPSRSCVDSFECAPDEYCAFDDGTCVTTPTDPNGTDLWACTGTCRPINPICDTTTATGGGSAGGGAVDPTFAFCEGVWEVRYDSQGCSYPICVCGDGLLSPDGYCFDQCSNVNCFAPPPVCDVGFHVEFGFPHCCGVCVPDDVCAYYDVPPSGGGTPGSGGGSGGLPPDQGVYVCAEPACAPGFHPEPGLDCCPVCVPDAARPCASNTECQAGELCTTENGVCDAPPGCDPAGNGCVGITVCYGLCEPASGCVDSDGVDPFTQGEVVTGSNTAGTADTVFVDHCSFDGVAVIEFYCSSSVGALGGQEIRIECPSGCYLGACTQAP